MHPERRVVEKELIRVGVEGFIVENDSLLLGKRKGVVGEGEWGLPGGHLERESLEQCLERELWEELGVRVESQRLIALDNNPSNIGGHYLHIGFLIEKYSGEISNKEPDKCSEWRFFPLDSLPENIFSAHKREIELFRKGILYGRS